MKPGGDWQAVWEDYLQRRWLTLIIVGTICSAIVFVARESDWRFAVASGLASLTVIVFAIRHARRLAAIRCPRCGNRFTTPGRTAYRDRYTCMSCGLRVGQDPTKAG